jgi:hypothetical protein
MAQLLRLLPDSASPHEPRSVDPSKTAVVSLAAVANRARPLQRTMPSWRIKVQCGGRGRLAHRPLAKVRTPVGLTGAAQQLFRLARSPPNPSARPSLTRSNRRGADPYARWCGRGGAAMRPPIPIPGAKPSAFRRTSTPSESLGAVGRRFEAFERRSQHGAPAAPS